MRNVSLFMMVSLDGYMEGENHDLSWHHVDGEFNEFAAKQLQEADTLLFGRRTYQLMESFWPTQQGLEGDPVVATLMNETKKIVFSKTLTDVKETPLWRNVRLVRSNIKEEIEKLKQESGKDIIVLGSNNLCVTLLQENVLDEIRLMINPIVIGKGTPLFGGREKRQPFRLDTSRQFANGNILLTYSVRL